MALEPPLQYPKARGADITPRLIKVDWDQHPVPFGSQALFPVLVRDCAVGPAKHLSPTRDKPLSFSFT